MKNGTSKIASERSLGGLLADGFAVCLSWILNPLIVPGAVYALILYQFGATQSGILHGAGIGFLLFALIPGLGIIWLRARGDIDSFDIRTKEKRVKPMLLGLVCNLLAIVIVARADFPAQSLILASTIAFLMVGFEVFVITKFWKISIHLSTFAALIAVLIISGSWWSDVVGPWPESSFGPFGSRSLSNLAFLDLGLGAILLMWARVRCKVHSFAQVAIGFLLGLSVHLLAFWVLSILLQ